LAAERFAIRALRANRQHRRGGPVCLPTGRDVLAYIEALYDAVCTPDVREPAQVQKMKKYLNYIGAGVERPAGSCTISGGSRRARIFSVCAPSISTMTERCC